MNPLLDVEILVTRVRSRGEFGGVIFYGRTDTGERYAARLSWKHVPDVSFVDTGQRWRVRGPATIITRSRQDGSGTDRDTQIEAESADLLRPAGKNLQDWISRSQECRGIGPAKARELYETLGPALVTIIEERNVAELMAAGRLTESQAVSLCDAFIRLDIGSTLLWLDQFQIPRKIGNKVVHYYGNTAANEIEANPYVLVSFEANWHKVDNLARTRFKIALDDSRRLQSAIEEALYRAQDRGHTCLPTIKVQTALSSLLKDSGLARKALEKGCTSGNSFFKVGDFFQSAGMHVIEAYLARRFISLTEGANEHGQRSIFASVKWDSALADDVVRKYEANAGIALNKEQREAIEMASREHLSLVIGPAGTGKTTVLNALRRVITELNPSTTIFQMAPTGLAAMRMTLATGTEGTTIHWFLYNVKTEDIPLDAVVIIDEASMLDVLLAYRLFRHIPEGVRVIFVGDPGQLPPVGPGLILHLLAESPLVPKVRLVKVLRQRESSGIPGTANQVREGLMPHLPTYAGLGSGVSFLECEDKALCRQALTIHEQLRGDSNYDVQVLSPTRSGYGGVKSVNSAMHEAYRQNDRRATRIDPVLGELWLSARDRIYLKERDKIAFTKNEYRLGLRNGSLGIVESVVQSTTVEAPVIRALFEGVRVELAESDLEYVTHSYGITIHKSQGSQFRRVIVVLKQCRVLTREAIYTAITRGVEQVVIVGSYAALKAALTSSPSNIARHTLLGKMLRIQS